LHNQFYECIIMSIFDSLFQYVLSTITNKQIDESHGLSHAMNVLHNAHQIYQIEIKYHDYLKTQEKIIYIAAILHDMCDKKYMNEEEGIRDMNTHLNDKFHIQDDEIEVINSIIRSMSYSTVKKNGFPELGKYQHAYHIVREADLLAAYDFDRAMIYHLYKNNSHIEDVCKNSIDLFDVRIFQHENDGLLLMRLSKQLHPILVSQAEQRIQFWKTILNLQ